VREWLSRIDKDTKEARDKRIFDLWLACWTQEAIGEEIGITKETVSEIVSQKMANLPESDKAVASHATDFAPPLYNVWKQQEKAVGFKGNQHTDSASPQNEGQHTAERLVTQYGVSRATIESDDQYAAAVDTLALKPIPGRVPPLVHPPGTSCMQVLTFVWGRREEPHSGGRCAELATKPFRFRQAMVTEIAAADVEAPAPTVDR